MSLLMVNCKKVVFRFPLFILIAFSLYAQQLAFPTAEGFGRWTTGGRAGQVIAVTNLNDSGPGSLREAVETSGPRTIIFRLSGTIILKSPLIINQNDVTIAGQTTPGDGICIRGYPVIVDADNVIIRFIRFRMGDENKIEADALSAIRQKSLIIDHCSISWGNDEAGTFYDNENATIQWCIISESLNHSYHHKGDHGYGGIWGGKGASFHHNVLAHHLSRTPRFCGSRYHKRPEKELVDFRNNVIYNWGINSAYGGESGQHNIVANYYKAGPATKIRNRIVEPWDALGKWFVKDNFIEGFPGISADNWQGGVQGEYVDKIKSDSAFPVVPVETQKAEDAYVLVLKNAGAVLPKRDAADIRIIDDIKNGTASYKGIFGPGIIDSQEDAGGWPDLISAAAPGDTDKDGVPDIRELKNGQDPNIYDSDQFNKETGYTFLEEYLNQLAEKP